MKKIIILIAAVLTAVVLSASSAFTSTVTKNYDFRDFNSISASNFFEVTVRKSSVCEVKVTVSKEYEDYLEVNVRGGKLSIGFRQLPAKLSTTQIGKVAKAEVSLPSLAGVSLSGASKLISHDSFEQGRGVFNLSVSGASQLEALEVNAHDAQMNISGASKCRMSGSFVDLHLSVAGASRAELAVSAEDLEAKSAGTSVIELDGIFDSVELNASGAGNITMRGEAEEVDARGSGAVGFDLEDLEAKSVEVGLSGASVAKVNALKELEAGLSGSSKCSYVDHRGLRIHKRLSGASKLKTL